MTVRCQISRPVDSWRGPFAGSATEIGPTAERRRSRSGCLTRLKEDVMPLTPKIAGAGHTDTVGRSTTVVNLILRSAGP
jgi:hypothetical protein